MPTAWRSGPACRAAAYDPRVSASTTVALPVDNFSTTTGVPTNAVFGFTSMLANLLRDEKPTHIAVAFDVSRTTFRTEQFPAYKATRDVSPPEFSGQVRVA